MDICAIKTQKGANMKTKSIWGRPPTRLYNLIKLAEQEFLTGFSACVVGCSDGKFVFPFARKGHYVTGYEVDKTALYGGVKKFPIKQQSGEIITQELEVQSINTRVNQEHLQNLINIEELDFYKNVPNKQFEVVFTSCSLHYTLNSQMSLAEKTAKLQQIVAPKGFLYIDYMMAIDENDFVKFPQNKFYRSGEILKYFDLKNWKLISYRENKKTTLEHAHVECPFDHYHRFGYICMQKQRGK